MRKSTILALFTTLLLGGLMSCGSKGNVVHKAFPSECWALEDTLTGTFEVKENQKYLLYFPLTATDDYPYYNLFMKGEVIAPTGMKEELDQLEFQLLSQEGAWMGDCSGASCSFNLQWSTEKTFGYTGTYTFKLYHFMRDQPLCGISEVGIGIKPIN